MAFCVEFGARVEWSFACPDIGIAFDCCVLLMSEDAAEVVAGASLVGPAGTVPTMLDCEVVSLAVAAGACASGIGETASEQLARSAAVRTIAPINPC